MIDINKIDLKDELETETKTALDEWERGCYETIADLLLTHQKYIFDKMKQYFKSACEFYLKYMNRPDRLAGDYPEYHDEIDHIWGKHIDDDKFLAEYNEWLFKLVFKDYLNI